MPKKLDSIKQSVSSALGNTKMARKAYDRTWSVAARAPIFCKVTKKSMGNGRTKKTYRGARLISRHAYKIAASGAAMNALRIAAGDCKTLRVSHTEENSRAPWLPGVSKGAQMVVEQFLAALAQEAAYRAQAVRQGTTGAQRVNADHMRMGWEATVDNVFGASAPLPRSMIVLHEEKEKKAKRSKPDGEKEEGKKGKKEGKKGKKARADADEDEYQQPEEVDVEGDASDLLAK